MNYDCQYVMWRALVATVDGGLCTYSRPEHLLDASCPNNRLIAETLGIAASTQVWGRDVRYGLPMFEGAPAECLFEDGEMQSAESICKCVASAFRADPTVILGRDGIPDSARCGVFFLGFVKSLRSNFLFVFDVFSTTYCTIFESTCRKSV